jgi:hypothetical protein
MKQFKKVLILFVLFVSTTSCEKDDNTGSIDKTYYQNEIFSTENQAIYGDWQLFRMVGGKWGGEYPLDFNILVVKKYGVFNIIHNDSIICSGKIVINTQNDSLLVISLEKYSGDNLLTIQCQKRVIMKKDSLFLDENFDCTDSYKYCFVRKE